MPSANAATESQVAKPARLWSTALGVLLLLAVIAVMVGVCIIANQDRRRVAFWVVSPFVVGFASKFVALYHGPRCGDLAGLGAAIAILLALLGFLRLGTARDGLYEVGDGIVRALEDFRQSHGKYPDTLDEAGIRPDWNRFGGWYYDGHGDGSAWSLSVGDYGDDGFVIHRSSDSKDWGYDG